MTQIKKGALISYFAVIFNIISGFFFTPFLIGKVGVGPYGIYILVTSFLNYFLIDFGLGNAVAKYLSEYRSRNDIENANWFISVLFKLFMMIAFIIGIIVFIMYFFLDSFFSGLTIDEMTVLKKMYVISGFSSIILFIFIPLDGMLVSYELFFEQKIIELLRKILIVFISCLVLVYCTDIVNIVLINALVGFLIVGLKLVVIKSKTIFHIQWNYFDISIVKKVGGFSFWLTIIMIAQRFIIPFAPTILGRYSNSIEISIFSIAMTIEGYLYTIAACLNGLFLPKITDLYFNNKINEINSYFKKVGRLQTYIIGAVISAFIIFGKEFIGLWVGGDFIDSYYVVLLIAPSSIVVYAQEVANSLILIQEKHKYKAYCYLAGASISAIITCILAPKMGAIGAGVGIAVCLWGCQVIIMNFIYCKMTVLDIKGFFINCYGKVIPCLILTTFIGVNLNSNIVEGTIFVFLLKCSIYTVLVGIIYFFVIFTNEEKLVLKQYLRILEGKHE